jgi:hypothetical protein
MCDHEKTVEPVSSLSTEEQYAVNCFIQGLSAIDDCPHQTYAFFKDHVEAMTKRIYTVVSKRMVPQTTE